MDEVESLLIQQVQQLVSDYLEPGGFYKQDSTTYEAARSRLLFLKDVIENKGGHRLFYIDGEPMRRELDLQILYRLTWFASPHSTHQEVNDGRGPADFLVANGSKDVSLVELKLASNAHLRRNLEKQCEIYEKASDATNPSLKGILFFSAAEEGRLEQILDDLGLSDSPHVITLDARADNKPSGSKA